MVAIATNNLVSISDGESITNWTGDSFELEPDIKVEGSNSVACTLTNNGANAIYYAGSFNLTGNTIRLYVNTTIVGNMNGTTAVQVTLHDTTTEAITYFPTGADYGGGWVDLVIDVGLFTTITPSAITRVGVTFNTASKPRNVPQNSWFDNWRCLNGLTLTSTTTEAYDFSDAAASDATNVYGVLVETDGVIFCVGEVIVGDATSNSNLVSVNETLVFPDRQVSSSLYKLEFNSGTGTTDIDISGMVCKTVNSAQAAELLLDASYDSLSITGSSFITMGTMTITPTVTAPVFSGNAFTGCGAATIGLDMSGCSFNSCDTVTVNSGSTLTGCSFDSSTAASSVVVSDLSQIDGCSFVSDGTNNAVELTALGNGSMTWDAVLSGYSGTTTNAGLFVNVGSGTLDITIAAGATDITGLIRTAGATVNIVVSTTLELTGLIAGSEVRVYEAGTTTEIDGVETSGTSFSTTITVSAVDISILSLGYLNLRLKNQSTTTDRSIPIQQVVDRQYANN